MARIGILHPGEMGASVARALVLSGHEVLWCSDGRSEQTVQRAAGLTQLGHLEDLLAMTPAGILSICPPDAALAQAARLLAIGYAGLYVDANAIAPATANEIAALAGSNYVDGGLIGPPALQPDTTRFYVSGLQAEIVQSWFVAGDLQVVNMGAEPTAASALKMAYAAYTKGTSALLLAVNALANIHGVEAALHAEWALSQPQLPSRSERTARGISARAWRFQGEMLEIAQAFDAAGLSGDFHHGAADVFARLADFKDQPGADLQQVVRALVDSSRKA